MLIHTTLIAAFASAALAKGSWESPEYKWIFQYPLPLPQTKTPLKQVFFCEIWSGQSLTLQCRTFTNPSTGKPLDYYEVDIKPVEQQIYPNLKKTRMVGYDGQVPGPTFQMTQGREAIVRFINHGDRANSVHLHGSYSRAPFDG
jgi:bilirubin oxidase